VSLSFPGLIPSYYHLPALLRRFCVGTSAFFVSVKTVVVGCSSLTASTCLRSNSLLSFPVQDQLWNIFRTTAPIFSLVMLLPSGMNFSVLLPFLRLPRSKNCSVARSRILEPAMVSPANFPLTTPCVSFPPVCPRACIHRRFEAYSGQSPSFHYFETAGH